MTSGTYPWSFVATYCAVRYDYSKEYLYIYIYIYIVLLVRVYIVTITIIHSQSPIFMCNLKQIS